MPNTIGIVILIASTRFRPYNYTNQRKTQTRSMYLAKKPDYSKPNWLRISLAFGTSIFLWVMLFQQHQYDLAEYERRQESSIAKAHEKEAQKEAHAGF
uniref:NADH dehydrogenase [ubiquinone] 1 subunit C1, mitochondrial n=1 Tax=Geotrypetes seraphini TaxID=260995 RepID=A0A6P8R8R8_GEOSA|nr:NADH dehydrogenase [ubiquinone] 1 subunit C1, mitochondrial isoform X2 [Geotrypetes seraphini]